MKLNHSYLHFASFIYFSWLITIASADPIAPAPDKMEATLVKLRHAMTVNDEFVVNDPVHSKQYRLIRQLPPEVVPLLIHDAQETKSLEEEEFDEYLLRLKITHYGVDLPEDLRHSGIDFLINRCAKTDNVQLRRYLLEQLKYIDEPNIDSFVGRLALSANSEQHSAALEFAKDRPSILEKIRKKPVPLTYEQLVSLVDYVIYPDRAKFGRKGEIALESVPTLTTILTNNLQDAQDGNVRWRYMQFLSSILERYEDSIPIALWRNAIDAMTHECERTDGIGVQKRLVKLASFDDSKIDQCFERMATSSNSFARITASSLLKDRNKQ